MVDYAAGLTQPGSPFVGSNLPGARPGVYGSAPKGVYGTTGAAPAAPRRGNPAVPGYGATAAAPGAPAASGGAPGYTPPPAAAPPAAAPTGMTADSVGYLPGMEGLNPIFGVNRAAQMAANPRTPEEIAANQARQADIRANGDFMQPRFDVPVRFNDYLTDRGVDPSTINAGNFYDTFHGMAEAGTHPSRRAFESGFGGIIPGLMDMRGDIGRRDIWNYLKGGAAGNFGDYLYSQSKEGRQAAKPPRPTRPGGPRGGTNNQPPPLPYPSIDYSAGLKPGNTL